LIEISDYQYNLSFAYGKYESIKKGDDISKDIIVVQNDILLFKDNDNQYILELYYKDDKYYFISNLLYINSNTIKKFKKYFNKF
jgi:hypothetical protein